MHTCHYMNWNNWPLLYSSFLTAFISFTIYIWLMYFGVHIFAQWVLLHMGIQMNSAHGKVGPKNLANSAHKSGEFGPWLFRPMTLVYPPTDETAVTRRKFKWVPVLIALGFELIQWGRVRPVKNENPMMKRLRDEFKSTYWRFDSPTATIIPETRKILYDTSCAST